MTRPRRGEIPNPGTPVSYREKIRVLGRSKKKIFEYFFHGFGDFLLGFHYSPDKTRTTRPVMYSRYVHV